MAFLEDISPEDRLRLVSLPYRVGLWVSHSDSTGGDEAGAREGEALESIITKFVQGMFESAFVHEVIAETFLNKAAWPQWTRDISAVPDECRAAIRSLQGRISQRDVDAYRHILMQIGVDVARAFREYDKSAPIGVRLQRGFSLLVDRIFGALQGEKFASDTILNISYEEDLALNALAKALRADSDAVAEGVGAITNS